MRFEKISFEQWEKDFDREILKNFNPDKQDETIRNWYDSIEIPERKTRGSAGYDFAMPFSIQMQPQSEIMIPTGICWVCTKPITKIKSVDCNGILTYIVKDEFDPTKVLKIYPRSGLGVKHGIRLANTTGIVDSDYYQADNEGHIFVKLVNPSEDVVSIPLGKGFCQGIIQDYHTCENEGDITTQRIGGHGSTDKEGDQ